jgi:hypothetical protein
MKKHSIKILLLILSLVFAACSGNDDSTTGGIFEFDQTQEAASLVAEANDKLKQIKKLFNENEGRLEELKAAMNSKDEKKVKEISKELVYQINNGTKLGEDAIEKIEEAQGKNTNDDFKNYLGLKTQGLRKYIEAFEERRELAKLLNERYDPKNAAQRDIVLEEFKRREEKFKLIMEEGRKSSEDANALAKESLSKVKN